MRRLFITSGAGFIGSSFIRLLAAQTNPPLITNFDALTYAGNLDNLQGLESEDYRFVRGDIADKDAVVAAMQPGTDAIINFAAESHVDRSIASASEFIRTKVLGTQVCSMRRARAMFADSFKFRLMK